jgi:phosphate transport system protein
VPERLNSMLHEIASRLAEEADHVQRALTEALCAFVERDSARAAAVVRGDDSLDVAEVALERLCLDALALHQPMAVDLRYVAAALRVNGDLERMGDLASNVAKHAQRLEAAPPPPVAERVRELGELARAMVRSAAEALAARDAEAARAVWLSDADVDAAFEEVVQLSLATVHDRTASVADASLYVAVAGNLERIGDLAKNIAEDVLFVVAGRIVRHGAEGPVSPG